MNITTARICSTNVYWSVTIAGSKGASYTVEFKRIYNGPVQYDYVCTCPINKYKHKVCKHIEQAKKLRCAWNEEMDPFVSADLNDGKWICPRCNRDTEVIKIGV